MLSEVRHTESKSEIEAKEQPKIHGHKTIILLIIHLIMRIGVVQASTPLSLTGRLSLTRMDVQPDNSSGHSESKYGYLVIQFLLAF